MKLITDQIIHQIVQKTSLSHDDVAVQINQLKTSLRYEEAEDETIPDDD